MSFSSCSVSSEGVANVGVPGSLVIVSAPRVPIVRKPSKSSEMTAGVSSWDLSSLLSSNS